ncbi:MAG: YhbY family RNA-binding protein [Zoogloeaceae bacterium]|nr:YhbY family RNA-binding protein [Zoogloeaceae bacterium]
MMMPLQLDSAARRVLRAKAHALNPVVAIAKQGLSVSVLKEIDHSLVAHELVKISVFNDNRAEREGLLAEICEKLEAAPVQHIGKRLVIWRPRPEGEAAEKPVASGKTERRSKRSYQNA